MDELGFRQWLSKGTTNKKAQSDCVSRLKRIEYELEVDLDDKYQENQLEKLLLAFSQLGVNEEMKKYGNVNLPVGKSYMPTYRYSLNKYIQYKNEKKG
jgi:hypothetical protein